MSDMPAAPHDTPGEALARIEVAACPFCGSPARETKLENVGDWFFGSAFGASDFARCTACDSLWQPSPPSPATLPAAYTAYYTHEEPDDGLFAGARGALRRSYAAARLHREPGLLDRLGGALFAAISRDAEQIDAAMRFVPQAPARVLDYGCGSGRFLERLRGFGHAVEGVEFDPVAAAKVRAAGIVCLSPEEAAEAHWNGRFDAITLSHVIEHVYEPRALLKQLHAWLKPGGSLFVECPNAEAAGLAVFRRYWRGLEAPRHLAIPSVAGLDEALSDAGFVVTRSIVRAGVRDWMWAASMAVVPDEERETRHTAMASAAPETPASAEFITLAARKA